MIGSGRDMNIEEYSDFSKNLGDLKTACDSLDYNKVFEFFLKTFQKCIDTMKEILNYIGFSDRILGIQILKGNSSEQSPTEDENKQLEKIIIHCAAKNRLIKSTDLQRWEEMIQVAGEDKINLESDKLYVKIKKVYLLLLDQFKDTATYFFKSPDDLKAMDGKKEVFYIKHCFIKFGKDRKVKKYYAEDENTLQVFHGQKVQKKRKAYQNIVSEYGPDLYPGVDAFWKLNGYVIFTDRRIIIVRFKLERDKKEYYFSYPYGKINYFEIKRGFSWTKKRGLLLEFAGGPSLSLHFESRWYIGFNKIVSTISNKLIK